MCTYHIVVAGVHRQSLLKVNRQTIKRIHSNNLCAIDFCCSSFKVLTSVISTTKRYIKLQTECQQFYYIEKIANK